MKQKTKIMALFLAFILVLGGCGKTQPEDKPAEEAKGGEFTEEVEGYGGKFTVITTISAEGKIEKVEVGENGETQDIGSNAIDKLPAKIVEKQSLAVDVVTGATVTSEAILKAVEAAIEKAGLKVEDFKTVKEDEKAEDETIDTDIVVIGGGGAGLSAAVAAAQNDAKVILLEKTAALGGNTVRAGGPYNAVDQEKQKNAPAASDLAMESVYALAEKEAQSEDHQKWMDQLKKDLEEYEKTDKDFLFDSIALHILQTYDGGDYAGKLPFIEKLVEQSLPTADWLVENGLNWRDEVSTCPGGLWPRAHIPENAAGADYINTNSKLAEKLGVEIILECSGKELIVDGDKVVGLIAEKEDGSKLTINTSKGVIMATGGFAANKEMRQKYNPDLSDKLQTTNSPAITGDGIVMAEAVGANTIGMEFIQCLPLGNPDTGGLNGWMGGIGVEFYYQVNKEGKRFMAEDGRRDDMTASLLAQTDQYSFVITDSNKESAEGSNIWGDDVEDLVEKKIIFRADTIEGLAEQMGVDPKVLKETHDTFNAYASKGKDEDFGRKLFGDQIDKAPFYASPRMPTVHHTMGGLEIDLEGRVLNKDGKPIEGLFAAGEVTGGIHGKNRLGGNALVDIHVFGKIAGETAAK